MTDTASIEVTLPEFMNLVDAKAREEIIKEVEAKIGPKTKELFENAARELIAERLNLVPAKSPEKPTEESEPETAIEVKTALAEEILTLPEKDALDKLKLSLAKGVIDKDTYVELRSLVRPTKSDVCPQCGRELEVSANFCRFCGSKVK